MTRKLRIINGSGPAEQSLQVLTTLMGFMEEFGVDAEYINESDGNKGLASLQAGRGDVCLQIGFGPALAAIDSGKPLRVIAGANLRAVHVVFSSRPDIRSVRDLEGARVGIGTPGALTHQLLTATMLKAGSDPSKVDWIPVGNSFQVFQAVARRVVDAGLGEVDNLHQQEQFSVHALPDGSLWDQLPEFTNQASYSTLDALTTKRDLIVGALAASARLYRYICGPGSWDKFSEARRIATPDADAGEARGQWGFYQEHRPYALDLVIGCERLEYMQRLNVTMGLQREVHLYEQVADMSLAREALKLLRMAGH